MFNGNKIEQNNYLNPSNEFNEMKRSNVFKNDHEDDDYRELYQNFTTNNYGINQHYTKKLSSNNDKLNRIRSYSKKNEMKNNFPNYLINLDLNKISSNDQKNKDKDKDIGLYTSNSFLNKSKQDNNRYKNEISPEKYLDDILKKNEIDIQENSNDIVLQTLSSENNQNSFLKNSIKDISEFDFFRNTLNKNKNKKENNVLKKSKNKKLPPINNSNTEKNENLKSENNNKENNKN